jgi:metallophosphoesterase superfamily enzyme
MIKNLMLKGQKTKHGAHWRKDEERVLVIGDTHFPFDYLPYLDFLIDTYIRFNCTRVVHAGDCGDHHALSFHDSDPSLQSAGDEQLTAMKHFARYYKVFPEMDVLWGNHSRMVSRKAFKGGITSNWIKDYNEFFNVPNWKYHHELEIDGVLYIHGEGGTARTKAKNDLQSVVQGHIHTAAYVEYIVGRHNRIFGMQVGTGIDHESLAFAYSKAFKKPVLSCGVVIGGRDAFVVPMPMEDYKETQYPL